MCYSAQIKADYHDFLREHGAVISLKRFSELFWEKRQDGQWNKIPKAMRDAFRRPRGEDEFTLAKLVAEGDREPTTGSGSLTIVRISKKPGKTVSGTVFFQSAKRGRVPMQPLHPSRMVSE
ncbi:MAG: hypothetical protein ABI268_00545 [Rhodanobacter sp.]